MIAREFLRLHSANTEDMLTDAAVHVLAAGGAEALSLKAVARWLRVTPARVSQMVTRDRLPFVVTARFALRWTDWIEERWQAEGVMALLPTGPAEVAGVRVWLALSEIARAREDCAELLSAANTRERARLDALPLSERHVDLVLAATEGLRTALCRGDAPMTPAQARDVLALAVDLLPTPSNRPITSR